MNDNMTERLDEAKKYIGLFKIYGSRSKNADIYWSKAANILMLIDKFPRNEEEHKEAISLADEMVKSFGDNLHFHMLVDEEFETEIKRFMEDKIGNKSKRYYNGNRARFRSIIKNREH